MAPVKSINYISRFTAQKRICVLWFIFSFVIILLFILFTITNKFGIKTAEIWQWIMQQILPVLTLITGVFVTMSRQTAGEKRIKKFYYRLSMWLSTGYFILLILTIAAIPFAYEYASIPAFEFLKTSSLYLLPVLGIVTLSMGIFFTKEES